MVQSVTVSCALWWYSMAYQYHWIPDVRAPFQWYVWFCHLTQQGGTLIPFTEKTCKVEETIGVPWSKTKATSHAVKLGPKLLLHALRTLSLQSAKVDDEESRCDPNSPTHIWQRFYVVPSNCKCHPIDRIICLPHGKVGDRRSLTGTFIGRTVFS